MRTTDFHYDLPPELIASRPLDDRASSRMMLIDRATGEVHIGRVPPYAVVVPGSLPGKPLPDGTPGPSLYCAVIVKTVDAQTRSKTGINELLRD